MKLFEHGVCVYEVLQRATLKLFQNTIQLNSMRTNGLRNFKTDCFKVSELLDMCLFFVCSY